MKSRRRNQRSTSPLFIEALETRCLLSVDGLLEPFFIPDSEPGDDPHGDVRGSDATPLTLEDGYSVVTSYVDHAKDVDVFQVTLETDGRFAAATFHQPSGVFDQWIEL